LESTVEICKNKMSEFKNRFDRDTYLSAEKRMQELKEIKNEFVGQADNCLDERMRDIKFKEVFVDGTAEVDRIMKEQSPSLSRLRSLQNVVSSIKNEKEINE
jgi:hypothetical protein